MHGLSRFVIKARTNLLFEQSAALAFSTVLAIVPLLAIVFSIFTSFSAFEVLRADMEDFIINQILPKSADDIRGYLLFFTENAGKLSLFGFFWMFFSAVSLFMNLSKAVNHIWGCEDSGNLKHTIMLFWVLLTASPAALALYFVLVRAVGSFAGSGIIFSLSAPVTPHLPKILMTGMFFLFHSVLPNCAVPKRFSFIGAVTTVISLEFFKMLFMAYVGKYGSFDSIYGSLSIIPVFFIWIYANWLVILCNTQFVFILTVRRISADAGYHQRNMCTALSILYEIHSHFKNGEGGITAEFLIGKTAVNNQELRRILAVLVKEKILIISDNRYFPGTPAERIKISEIFSLFPVLQSSDSFPADCGHSQVYNCLR